VFAAHFGGPKGKKFQKKQLYEIIENSHEMNAEDQKGILNKGYDDWKGGLEQIDDITVIGFKV
jgi:hypothetical protein